MYHRRRLIKFIDSEHAAMTTDKGAGLFLMISVYLLNVFQCLFERATFCLQGFSWQSHDWRGNLLGREQKEIFLRDPLESLVRNTNDAMIN